MVLLSLEIMSQSEYVLTIFHFYRIKYTDEKRCIDHVIRLEISTAVIQKFQTHSSPKTIS